MGFIELNYTLGSGEEDTLTMRDTTEDIDLFGVNIALIDLKPLTQLEFLTSIGFKSDSLHHLDMSPLSSCSWLKNMWIFEGPLSSLELPSGPRLEEITVVSNNLSNIDLGPLSECPELKELHLQKNALSKIDLQPLAQCQNLRFINLSENKLSNVNLSPLNQCGGLEELLLDKNQMIEVELFGQTRVKRIDLKKNLLTRVDFAPLIHCENLVHLTLSDNKLEELDLEPLGSCKNLKSLDLQNNRLRSLDLSPLQDLKNFGVIYLSNNLLEAVNLSPLGGCVGLKTISLNDNKLAEIDLSPLDSHEPPENPQHLLLQHVDARESRRSARQSNSHGVQGISLQNNCIEKVVLCSSPTLQGINLSSNKLRSIDLRPLEGCTNLNAILLTNNPLEDIEFGQLGPEERLKVKLDPDIKV